MVHAILIACMLASATVAQQVQNRVSLTGAAPMLFKRQLTCPGTEGFCPGAGGFCCPNGERCCASSCQPPGGECCSEGDACVAGTRCVIYRGQPLCCIDGDCGVGDSGSSGDQTTLPGVTSTHTYTIPGGEGTSTHTISYTSSYTQTQTEATSTPTINPAPAPQPTIAVGEGARTSRSGVALAGGIVGLLVGLF